MTKKVKSIKTIAKSKIDNSEFVSSYTEYNSEGNTLNEVIYRDANTIESKSSFAYDDKGQVTEEVEYLDENEIAEKTTYFRNEDGKIHKVQIEYTDGSISRKEYAYDGNSLEISINDEDGEFEGTEKYLFDDKGNILEKEIVDCFQNIEEKEISEYDDDSNIIKRIEFDEDGDPLQISYYTYNENKDLTHIRRVNTEDEIIEEITLKYNEKGKITEQQFGSTYLIRYEYDDEALTKKEERFNANGELEFQTIYYYNQEGFLEKEENFFAVIDYEYTFFT